MSVVVAVFAEAPLPGRCAKALLAYHDPEWVARLYAAMLRDTLDGLEAIGADEHVVLANEDEDDEGRRALARHLPLPWTLARARAIDASDYVVVATAYAPAADVAPLAEAIATRAHVVADDAWLAGGPALALTAPSAELVAKIRAEYTNVLALPAATIVDGPAALEALLEELRRHHERAPRTALLAMTS
ncbi:MAG: hypothetical protein KIT84_41510 [Labilithrix sp.]|nr:hypothetical protein [Labilithrix sp.]MCW5817550.1 hypothetical protein [Labilithrix sp.]